MKGGHVATLVLVLSVLAAHPSISEGAKRSTECESDEFDCNSDFGHRCIPDHYVCDGANDCADGRDEDPSLCPARTPNCTASQFYCAPSKTCLHNRQRCDKVRDCPDDSDELNCPPGGCALRCKSDDSCLSQEQVCDRNPDCSDGSDESDPSDPIDQCALCSKNNGGCHHICVNRPTGPLCKCSPGYVLQGGNCYDINECSVYGTCSQLCQNTHGSVTCKCVPGYEMEEDPTKGQTCKAIGPAGALYVAANNSIVRYFLNGSSEDILIGGLKGVTDIAVDYQEQMIYWLELHNKTLKKASLQDMSNVEVIVSEGINSPEGLALDWLAKRLYWVDDMSNTVEVVNTDGSDRRVLKDGLDRPRDIVVDPFQKTLYISDWGTRPGIFSLKTDGSDFTSLVNTSISWPNGLALDFPGKRLYWVDAKYKIVETINLDGTGRVVVKQLPDGAHPWSIDVFEEMMMWSDSEGFRVSFSNRLSAEDIKSIHISQATLKGIKIVHRALQTTGALCSRPFSLPNYDLEDPKPFYDVGTVVTLRCAKGNRLTGCDMVKCQENGTWFPPLPNCEPVEGSPAPQRTSTDGLQSYSFGVGLVVGLAVCLLLAVIVVVAVVVCFVRKYKQSGRFSSPTISYYSDKHQETTVLPEDDELEPNLANGVPM